MRELDSILAKYADPETGSVPAAAFVAVNSNGKLIYSHAAGSRTVDHSPSNPVTTSSVFWLASMTKLVTAVACMIAVEQGLLDLDSDLRPLIPELSNVHILEGFEGEPLVEQHDFTLNFTPTDVPPKPILRKSERPITLRHLLTHTSGWSYDTSNESLRRWSAYEGRTANALCGSYEGIEHPLIFDVGDGWSYGVGMDWAGRIIETLSGLSFEEYMRVNLWDKLGMSSTTFRPELRKDFPDRLVDLAFRNDLDRSLTRIDCPLHAPVKDFSSGAGLYSTPDDFAKLLRVLIAGGEGILTKESVNEILKPQLNDKARKDLVRILNGSGHLRLAQAWPEDMDADHGLTVAINLENIPRRRKKGSAMWSGFANTHFWIDPKSGVAGALFTQMLPIADSAVNNLLFELEEALYQNVGS